MIKSSLLVIRADNGFILEWEDENENPDLPSITKQIVIEENEIDDLYHLESLVWHIWEHFGYFGSKHDAERLRVTREKRAE